ncbi:hypothetical protein GOD45_30145 [Sinorhizobium medicae]|nr:hypothetical protein [Sinorhizobium medicae]
MRYAALNTIRVLLCYAVMLTFAEWYYGNLFSYERAKFASTCYVFAFAPLPNVRLSLRLVYITLSIFPIIALHFVYIFFVNPANYTVAMESIHFFVLVSFAVTWITWHYPLFLLIYTLLEYFFVKKLAVRTATHSRP